MQTLAAVTYLLFLAYVANCLMLSAVAARQAGRSVWLLDTDGPLERATGWAFRIAVLGAVVWPALRQLWPASSALAPTIATGMTAALLGHLLVAVGAAIALIAQYHMGAAGRTGAAEGWRGELVQTGPFAISRNPVVLGQDLVFLGLFLAYPDLVQLLVSATAIIAAAVQVRIEERALKRRFGEAYDAYAARVPRWLGRTRSPEP